MLFSCARLPFSATPLATLNPTNSAQDTEPRPPSLLSTLLFSELVIWEHRATIVKPPYTPQQAPELCDSFI